MTSYSGVLSPSFVGGNFTPTPNLTKIPSWPYTGNAAVLGSATLCGTPVDNTPVSMPCVSHTGYKSDSITDLMYGRVYPVPNELDLGVMASGRTEEVEFWNASLMSVSCTDNAQLNMDGIVSDVPEVPFSLGALQSVFAVYDFGLDGPIDIDASNALTFDSNVATLVITGRRSIVLFTWPLDESGVKETLSWHTDIMTSRNGLEQRVKCRLAPRRTFSMQFFPGSKRLNQTLDNMLQAWRGRYWSLPLFPEFVTIGPPAMGADTLICDTSNMTLAAGDNVLLWQSNAVNATMEVAGVSIGSISLKKNISIDFTSQVRVCPVHTARLKSQPKKERHPCAGDKYTMEFVLQYPRAINEGEAGETYNDTEVLSESSRLYSGEWQPVEFVRAITEIDGETGQVYFESPTDFTAQQVELSFVELNKVEAFALRDFIARREGRLTPFFHPLFDRGIELDEDIADSATSLVVKDVDLSLLLDEATRNFIMLETTDGTKYYRSILGISEGDEGCELIYIDAAFGVEIAASDVKNLCILALMRLDTDEIEINWRTAPTASCKVIVVEVLQ